MTLVRYFEGDSVALESQPVSTRVVSQSANPDSPNGPPWLIDFTASAFSVAVLLADRALQDALANPWAELRHALVDAIPPQQGPASLGFCLPLVIALDHEAPDPLQSEQAFPEDGAIHAERAFCWPFGVMTEHGVVRILLHACRSCWTA